MRHRSVADVMSADVITVAEGTPFKDIARVLAEHRVSAVPVVDGEGRPVGVVSETDLVRKEQFQAPEKPRWYDRPQSPRARAAGTVAGEIMSSPPITIRPTGSLPDAAKRMAQSGVSRLLVVGKDGRLVGVVARSDLLRVFLASDDEIAARVKRDVVEYALWENPAAIRVTVRDGVVTLSGRLERRSLVPIAVHLTRVVDGVVDVVDQLAYEVDDTAPLPPAYAWSRDRRL